MRIISRNFLYLVVWMFLTALLTACGNKSTTLTSTTAPGVIYSHSVAFNNNGSLYAWGASTYGQLGNGDTTGGTQLSPVQIFTITNVAGVSAGGTHTLAFKSDDHTAWAWGNNGYGQLGNTTTTSSALPLQVYRYSTDEITLAGTLTGIIAVSAGGNHSLAIDNSNTIWAWGDNSYGQLGDGSVIIRYAAVQVHASVNGSPLTGVSKISAGGSHSLALSNGQAMSWGYNGFGQLGNKVVVFNNISTGLNSTIPKAVVQDAPNNPNLTNVTDIAAGGSHSLFIVNDGVNPATIWACGYNFLGQLGVGNIIDRNHGVVQVHLSTDTGFPIQVAAGLDHSLVLMSDHTVWAWGYNFSGQLGNGAPMASNIPVTTPVQVMQGPSPVTPLTKIVKIIAIGNHSLAVDSSGQIWAWGDNTFGQLGLGDATNRNYATPVPSLSSGADLYHP